MNFLNGKIKTLHFKYLTAAFGSALITSVYSIVDMAMVGRYHGPEDAAALAVVAPIWNIIYSLGLLMGIGGSVLFSTIRGKGGRRRAGPTNTSPFRSLDRSFSRRLPGRPSRSGISRCSGFSAREGTP